MHLLTVPERAMVTAMRAPLGDFRDWAMVREWAGRIADALQAAAVRTAPGP
jgi:menaquinone-dependent protoporphyrinogen oxidase